MTAIYLRQIFSRRILSPSSGLNALPGTAADHAAEHVICHLHGFLFNFIKHLNVRREIPLQTQGGFLFRHIQVAVHHLSPFDQGMIEGINRKMNLDFPEDVKGMEERWVIELFGAEVIIQELKYGKYADISEVNRFFTVEKWRNIVLKYLNACGIR